MEKLYEHRMQKALRMSDYHSAAEHLDRLQGRQSWKLEPRSPWYDYELLTRRYIAMLEVLREGRSEAERMGFLRSGAVRNLAGLGDMRLLRFCSWGTKELIEKYIQSSLKLIQSLYMPPDEEEEMPIRRFSQEQAKPIELVPLQVKENYLVEVLQSYGRTALVLHGGASFGASHLGVCKTLHEQGMLPKIILGSYIGALVASLICVTPEDELAKVLAGEGLNLSEISATRQVNGSSFRRKAVRFLKYGHVFDIHVLEEWTRKALGDLTFKEAYQKSSGRILNIPVWSKRRSEVPVLLNHLTAPDVLVWSAACAACALPGLYQEVTLVRKDPTTGAIGPWNPSAIRLESAKVVNEVPLARLTELFNANHFIVSHVPSFWSPRLPSSLRVRQQSFLSQLWRFMSAEVEHRINQLTAVGLMPSPLSRLYRFLRLPELGDIEIVPEIAFRDLKWILGNPTPEFLDYCLLKGQRAAWSWMTPIWVRCAIEFEIERALSAVRKSQ